jgi:hypothetical protein
MTTQPTDSARPLHPTFRLESRTLALPLILGFLVRIILLILAGDLMPVGDEAAYIENARTLLRTGSYDDVWPPGYSAFLALFLSLFGEGGLFAVRLVQVAVSPIIGMSILQIAHLVYGRRGALLAGYGWAIYLPLAFFTHRFWPETLSLTLFVPSLYLFACSIRAERPLERRASLLVLSGLLFGLSLYMKETFTYLAIFLVFLVLLFGRRRLAHALLFAGTIAVVLLPLTVRNYFHYDRFVLVGATLGKNVLSGLSADYLNHDYNHDPDLLKTVHLRSDGTWDFVARNFLAYGPGWRPSDNPNVGDRTREDLAAAARYALQYRSEFLLSRVKKVADLLTPLSFAVRDLRPWIYNGPLVSGGIKRLFIMAVVAEVLLVLPLGFVNLVRLRHDRRMFLFFLSIVIYVCMTGMLVSMSRYRVPMEPFLLVLAGGTLEPAPGPGKRSTTAFMSGVIMILLLLLWALTFEEVAGLIRGIWE